MATKKDDRLKVRNDKTGEIFTFVQYAGDGFIFAYDDMGHFKILYMHDVTVIT